MDKAELLDRLRLPLMAAPMSIASTPELVTACCRAGVIGCFPTHNAWKASGLDQWLAHVDSALRQLADHAGSAPAPYAVNINVSRAKPAELLAREIELCRSHAVPIVTTNVGDPSNVVAQVHDWGGIVIHDAVSVAQAERAVAAGVDGLMLVCAGAGGLGGNLSPMAFVPRVRSFFDGLIQVAGGRMHRRRYPRLARSRCRHGLHGNTFHRHRGVRCARRPQTDAGRHRSGRHRLDRCDLRDLRKLSPALLAGARAGS